MASRMQIFVKPPEVLMRDRLLGIYQVQYRAVPSSLGGRGICRGFLGGSF